MGDNIFLANFDKPLLEARASILLISNISTPKPTNSLIDCYMNARGIKPLFHKGMIKFFNNDFGKRGERVENSFVKVKQICRLEVAIS